MQNRSSNVARPGKGLRLCQGALCNQEMLIPKYSSQMMRREIPFGVCARTPADPPTIRGIKSGQSGARGRKVPRLRKRSKASLRPKRAEDSGARHPGWLAGPIALPKTPVPAEPHRERSWEIALEHTLIDLQGLQ
jgi:hypothetical protein